MRRLVTLAAVLTALAAALTAGQASAASSCGAVRAEGVAARAIKATGIRCAKAKRIVGQLLAYRVRSPKCAERIDEADYCRLVYRAPDGRRQPINCGRVTADRTRIVCYASPRQRVSFRSEGF